MEFDLGSVGVGQLQVLTLKPPILTVIPLTLHAHIFLPNYAEDESKRAMPGDIKTKAKNVKKLA